MFRIHKDFPGYVHEAETVNDEGVLYAAKNPVKRQHAEEENETEDGEKHVHVFGQRNEIADPVAAKQVVRVVDLVTTVPAVIVLANRACHY